MEVLLFLAVIIGIPFLIFIGLLAAASAAAKPAMRASRDRSIEQDLRDEVADADALQRAARKLLRERGE